MTFSEQLNQYLRELDASRKDLANASDLSPATISRYCSGQREPAYDSIQISQLASGLESLARQRGSSELRRDNIKASLVSSLSDGVVVDYEVFVANLNSLINALDVRISELARGIYSDSSYVSRILSGKRRPGNVAQFINEVSSYITHRFIGSRELENIAQLTGCDVSGLQTPSALHEHLVLWLGSNTSVHQDESIPNFLSRMDDFDLNGYMQSIRFDEIKIPPSIPQLPIRREYTGIKKMMEAELDFMKSTVLSKSNASCLLYSDMPMEEMASDPEFPGKYLFGLAMMLKKGLHLNFIHDVSRPFPELMMGLELYIPMYMTGLISPYYLPASQSTVFSHLLKVSGAAALEGYSISGHQADGKYILYRSRDELAHYKKRADELLSKAMPLMNIFRSERKYEYASVTDRIFTCGDVKFICSNLPIYFLEPDSANGIIDSLNLSANVRSEIRQYYSRMRKQLCSALDTGKVHLIIPDLSRARFEQSSVNLSFIDLFTESGSNVTYETYRKHIEELRRFSEGQPNFTLEFNPSPAYRNINITIVGDRMVIVSKEKSPAIHFVIYHKRMIRAFHRFIPPVV